LKVFASRSKQDDVKRIRYSVQEKHQSMMLTTFETMKTFVKNSNIYISRSSTCWIVKIFSNENRWSLLLVKIETHFRSNRFSIINFLCDTTFFPYQNSLKSSNCIYQFFNFDRNLWSNFQSKMIVSAFEKEISTSHRYISSILFTKIIFQCCSLSNSFHFISYLLTDSMKCTVSQLMAHIFKLWISK